MELGSNHVHFTLWIPSLWREDRCEDPPEGGERLVATIGFVRYGLDEALHFISGLFRQLARFDEPHFPTLGTLTLSQGFYSFEGREWEVVTEAAKDMISQMLVLDFSRRAAAKQLCQHRWFQAGDTRDFLLKMFSPLTATLHLIRQVAATAPAAALGAHMVKRLRAFAGMSRMKRLALVVLARTLTDNDVKRLRVSGLTCNPVCFQVPEATLSHLIYRFAAYS